MQLKLKTTRRQKMVVGSGTSKKKILHSSIPKAKKQKHASVSQAKLNDSSQLSNQEVEMSGSEDLSSSIKMILTPKQNHKGSKRYSRELTEELKHRESSGKKQGSYRKSSSEKQRLLGKKGETRYMVYGRDQEEEDSENEDESDSGDEEKEAGYGRDQEEEDSENEDERDSGDDEKDARYGRDQEEEEDSENEDERDSGDEEKEAGYEENIEEESLKDLPEGNKKNGTDVEQGSMKKSVQREKKNQRRTELPNVKNAQACKLSKKEKMKSVTTKFIVFITNIPFKATEEDVREHFKDILPFIKNIKLTKNEKTGKPFRRGSMEVDDYVSYAKALAMHRSNMSGRTIYVVPDKNMPKGFSKGLVQTDDEEVVYKVCVNQLPTSLSLKEITQHFTSVGPVNRFIIPAINEERDEPQSLVLELDDEKVYKKVLEMNGSFIDGHPILVEPLPHSSAIKKTKKRKADSLEGDPQNKKLKAESPSDNDQAGVIHRFALSIGSIPLTVTKEQLKKHFAEAGQVCECELQEPTKNHEHSSKTAYVRMADEEGYKNALALQGSTLEGQQLVVEAVKKSSEGEKKRFVAFVGNIPFAAKDEDIRKHFEDVGEILHVRVILNEENKSRGFSYVEFADQSSYEKSLTLHHSFMNGRRINVCHATRQKNSKRKMSSSSAVKHELVKVETLSQNQQLHQQSPKKRRSKPDQKKRAFNRSQKQQT